MPQLLSDICEYGRKKIPTGRLNRKMYISTENMIPDKGGIVEASSLPTTPQTQAFFCGDTLVSNIRPYFKKIWHATFDGGCSNDVLVFTPKESVDPTFLYYLLADDNFFAYSMSTSKGTKMPRGDKNAIMQYTIPNIPLTKQKIIAGILRSIDEKIEVYKAINDNLQQQAQAVFRSWFIDNPTSVEWPVGTFADFIEKMIAGDWGKDSPSGNNTEMVYCIRGADIPDVKAGNKGKMPTRFILPKNYATKHLVAGDIVVEISGGSPTQSTGRAAAISDSLLSRYDHGMVCTNFCKALKPKDGCSLFVYHYWQYLYDKGVFFSYENGTTGIKNLDIGGFVESEAISIPPDALIFKFDSLCQGLMRKIHANGYENEQLALMRDTLLPRLMSGEIDVSDVEI